MRRTHIFVVNHQNRASAFTSLRYARGFGIGAVGMAGSRTVNVLPMPSALSTEMGPVAAHNSQSRSQAQAASGEFGGEERIENLGLYDSVIRTRRRKSEF